jgi:hypothetical protein
VAWWRVHAWRSAYQERPAIVAQRDAAILKINTMAADIERQAIRNQENDNATAERARVADAANRDLAGRLRHYQALRRPVCPAPAAPGEPDAAGPEPGDRAAIERGFERVEQATEAHLVAAGEDAEFLTGLQTYVRGLPKRCVAD